MNSVCAPCRKAGGIGLLLLALGLPGAGAPLRVKMSGFQPDQNGVPHGWKTWAHRQEIAPRTFIDPVRYRSRPGSLAISGNSNPAAYGGWEYEVRGIEAGKWYRFAAYYRAEGMSYEPLQVVARLDWSDPRGKRAGEPDYPYAITPEGEWKRLTLDAPAPAEAAAVKIQLFLSNAPQGTVWWDEISLEEIAAPAPRAVTVATIRFQPSGTGSREETVRRFVEVIDKSVKAGADLILLPESMTSVGTGKSYVDVSESVPGPTTAALAEVARRRHAYIAAGLLEREGPAVYNTAVLIDRSGGLVGKYRKVYLPREEIEVGLTPGSSFPVFQTDFGKIGMMICWDSEYADAARALAMQGAELILMPIWDGTATLVKARAVENRVFLVTSSYGDPSAIMDPTGEVVASTNRDGTAATATIDLNRRYDVPHLGNMRERFMKELRLDVQVGRPGFVQPR